MNSMNVAIACASTCLFAGCAGLDFGKEGLNYYESTPYFHVSVSKDCVSTATLTSLPGKKRQLYFDRGYGSAEISITLVNGMLSDVGQKTDSKVPDTITSIAALGTAVAQLSTLGTAPKADKAMSCLPTGVLYPIKDGVPDLSSPLSFPIVPKS